MCLIFVVYFLLFFVVISYKPDPVVTKLHPVLRGFVCVYVCAYLIVTMVSELMLWKFISLFCVI